MDKSGHQFDLLLSEYFFQKLRLEKKSWNHLLFVQLYNENNSFLLHILSLQCCYDFSDYSFLGRRFIFCHDIKQRFDVCQQFHIEYVSKKLSQIIVYNYCAFTSSAALNISSLSTDLTTLLHLLLVQSIKCPECFYVCNED